jgi:hypothetical protein
MTTVCKEWYILATFYQPLCNNLMQPRAENDSCPVCVVPYQDPDTSSTVSS